MKLQTAPEARSVEEMLLFFHLIEQGQAFFALGVGEEDFFPEAFSFFGGVALLEKLFLFLLVFAQSLDEFFEALFFDLFFPGTGREELFGFFQELF